MKSLYQSLQIILIAITSFFIPSCGNAPVESTEDLHNEGENIVVLTPEQIKTAGIELGQVEQKQISGTIKVNGLLDVPPQQLVSVSAPLGGFLKSTVLLQGSQVKKGQVIAVIENLEYIQLQQDYLDAKNQFEFAQVEYDRQQELAKENVNAQKTWQQAKANYQSWLAKKNGLLAKLKLIQVDVATLETGVISSTSNIYSPINGFVTEVNVNIGKFVNPTDVLFEIVDTEHLHAELIIFEKDAPKIKIGQKVRFTLANETSERMATVYLIGREINADRTIRIHCHIDKEDKDLLPGMYLKALVETGAALVPALPNEAIIDFEGKKYVFVKSEGGSEHQEENQGAGNAQAEPKDEGTHFAMQEVSTGPSELGYTEIVLPEGWSNENEVVVKGAYAILSKMKNSEGEGHAH